MKKFIFGVSHWSPLLLLQPLPWAPGKSFNSWFPFGRRRDFDSAAPFPPWKELADSELSFGLKVGLFSGLLILHSHGFGGEFSPLLQKETMNFPGNGWNTFSPDHQQHMQMEVVVVERGGRTK